MYGVGSASILGGAITLILSIKKSRQQTPQETKMDIRKSIVVIFVTAVILAGMIFAGINFMTRQSVDEGWAAKVIKESTDLQLLLERFHDENGEFPTSLNEIDKAYTQPTEYLTRNSDAPETANWYYDRIGPDDYQLYATAYSWVSYFDAMVYRKSARFNEAWFGNRTRSNTQEIKNWRYIRGFSSYEKQHYFDADGNPHRHSP